jgi:hypothetical protein
MTKKSYNPFKMWGSYVGLVLFIVLRHPIYYFNLSCKDCFSATVPSLSMLFTDPFGFFTANGYVIGFFNYAIIGFLIGWGIHSLIRSLRK